VLLGGARAGDVGAALEVLAQRSHARIRYGSRQEKFRFADALSSESAAMMGAMAS